MDFCMSNQLASITLAPWIQVAFCMIDIERRIGGNQFRHQANTLNILLDYKYVDPVLLKASLIHDLIEEYPTYNITSLMNIDSDAGKVLDLVIEVTRRQNGGVKEDKNEYLNRILQTGSKNSMILKCADRIQNLTDMHKGFDETFIRRIVSETEKYIIPMAQKVDLNMEIELIDLVASRKEYLEK